MNTTAVIALILCMIPIICIAVWMGLRIAKRKIQSRSAVSKAYYRRARDGIPNTTNVELGPLDPNHYTVQLAPYRYANKNKETRFVRPTKAQRARGTRMGGTDFRVVYRTPLSHKVGSSRPSSKAESDRSRERRRERKKRRKREKEKEKLERERREYERRNEEDRHSYERPRSDDKSRSSRRTGLWAAQSDQSNRESHARNHSQNSSRHTHNTGQDHSSNEVGWGDFQGDHRTNREDLADQGDDGFQNGPPASLQGRPWSGDNNMASDNQQW